MKNQNAFNSIAQIIKDRRAVFPVMYSDENIPLEDVKSLLALANWAPTHRRTEPWRFVVVSGDALLRLEDALVDAYTLHVGEDKVKESTVNKIRSKCQASQHIILIIMRRDPEERVPEWEEIAATAMSVQNFWLAVSAAGYGGYWSTPGFAGRLASFAELEKHERCLGLFYLGVPKMVMPSGTREPFEEKVRLMS